MIFSSISKRPANGELEKSNERINTSLHKKIAQKKLGIAAMEKC